MAARRPRCNGARWSVPGPPTSRSRATTTTAIASSGPRTSAGSMATSATGTTAANFTSTSAPPIIFSARPAHRRLNCWSRTGATSTRRRRPRPTRWATSTSPPMCTSRRPGACRATRTCAVSINRRRTAIRPMCNLATRPRAARPGSSASTARPLPPTGSTDNNSSITFRPARHSARSTTRTRRRRAPARPCKGPTPTSCSATIIISSSARASTTASRISARARSSEPSNPITSSPATASISDRRATRCPTAPSRSARPTPIPASTRSTPTT